MTSGNILRKYRFHIAHVSKTIITGVMFLISYRPVVYSPSRISTVILPPFYGLISTGLTGIPSRIGGFRPYSAMFFHDKAGVLIFVLSFSSSDGISPTALDSFDCEIFNVGLNISLNFSGPSSFFNSGID